MLKRKVIIIGKRANLSQAIAEKIDHCTLIASSDLDVLPSILENSESVDIIYNSFVKSSQLYRKDQPAEYARYTINLLSKFTEYCLKYSDKINTVILTSSSSVYGDNDCATESDNCKIGNLYASTKLASEFFLIEHLKETSIRLIIPRIFNMYGGRDEFSIISKIANAIKNEEKITIVNNGAAIRDFIHINDVVDIYLKLLESKATGVINIGTGKGTSVYEIIQAAEKYYRKQLKFISKEAKEINKSTANIEKLQQHITNYSFTHICEYFSED